jgi:hypothetical protein
MSTKTARKEIYDYLESIDKMLKGKEQRDFKKLLVNYEKEATIELTEKIEELKKSKPKKINNKKVEKKPIVKYETLEEYKERKSKIDFSKVKPSFRIK